jgi:hypothetical protein
VNAPKLTFFCELAAKPLQDLFADHSVTEQLVALGASVSLGILDLSPERVEVVRRLNQSGVPVVAWLLLPEDQGYWPNAANAPAVVARYDQVRAWSADHGLRWAGFALDVEPDQREIRLLLSDWRAALPGVLRRVVNAAGAASAAREYRELVARIRADGSPVDSYVIPLIADERQVGSTLLQRVGGLVDVPADREVPMLYTSIARPIGPGILWSYARGARSIGVGITGGGVQIGGVGDIPPLDWDELSRDLRLARHWTDDVHVFSLEGCVSQGFLGRILTLDWSEPVAAPADPAAKVERFRKALRALLWVDAHPIECVGGLIAAVWLLRRAGRICSGRRCC